MYLIFHLGPISKKKWRRRDYQLLSQMNCENNFFWTRFYRAPFFYDFYLSWPAVLTFIRKISYFSTCFFIFLIDRSVDVLWCLKTNLFLFNWWKIMLFSNRFVKWWNSLHILSFISNIISIVLWNKRYHFNVIS